MNTLNQHLQSHLSKLTGEWLHMNSNYENHICSILNMKLDKCRYWDACWNHHLIEFKKGRSIWLAIVRYSEILLKTNEDSRKSTLCLFFIPNKERSCIEEVFCVETTKLIQAVGLTVPQAESLVELKNVLPRSLNAQASLTVNDVRNIRNLSV